MYCSDFDWIVLNLQRSLRNIDLGNVKLCHPWIGHISPFSHAFFLPLLNTKLSPLGSCVFSNRLISRCIIFFVAMKNAIIFLATFFQWVFAGTEQHSCFWCVDYVSATIVTAPRSSNSCLLVLLGFYFLLWLLIYSTFLFPLASECIHFF